MELFYNPERMSETEIKETFVAHAWLVDEIMSTLAQQSKGAGVQHAIIVAPRGMGKTTVLLMLRFAVLNSEVAQHWQPVLFPEESYEVYDLADFWLAVLGHIADETAGASLDDEVSTLQATHQTTSELEEAALARIKDWREENSKQLLLLVDNFDIILQQIGDERDNAKLRDVLMNDGTMMLVGGATTFFKEARAYDQPLYNLFRIYNLQALTSEQMDDLLRRRAKLDGVEDFDETLRANSTRLRVLEYFTGGNPRLVLMLYRVITHSQISEVKRGLEKLLDEVTPYYKAKIETLPPQQRKILDHIARITARTREGLTPTEIAASTRLPVNQVSAQLKRLSDIGYVRAANIRGRSSYYTLSEPLYAIWHQMRFGRDVRKRMNWLVTFLKGWYDAEEVNTECQRLQDIFQNYLREGHVGEARDVLEYRRYLVEALDNKVDRSGTIETIILSYLDLKDFNTLKREILPDIDTAQLTEDTQARLVADGLISSDHVRTVTEQSAEANRRVKSNAALELAEAAVRERRLDEALKNFNEAIEQNPTSFIAYVGLAGLLATNGSVNELVAVLERAESAFPTDSPPVFLFRGLRAIVENDFEDAATNLDRPPNSAASAAWRMAGTLLRLMSKYDQALISFSRAVELDPKNFDGWYFRGNVLTHLGRYEEALESFDRGIQLEPDSYKALYARAQTLETLGRHADAILSLDRALEVNPNEAQGWLLRSTLHQDIENSPEALASIEKACELEPESYFALLSKSRLLGTLRRFEEALVSIDTILKLYPDSADALLLRGIILAAFKKREEDSLESLKKAFSITSGDHRQILDSSPAWSIKLMLALADGNIEEAKRDWQGLKESAFMEGGEARWLEVAAQNLRNAAVIGNLPFVRKLIDTSNLEEPLFPLARALDYLITGDETLVEKLSPEVRVIVEEIIDTLKNSTSKDRRQKKQLKNKSAAQASKSKKKKARSSPDS
jgi:tetratricopeptide (TPR) repeat protein